MIWSTIKHSIKLIDLDFWLLSKQCATPFRYILWCNNKGIIYISRLNMKCFQFYQYGTLVEHLEACIMLTLVFVDVAPQQACHYWLKYSLAHGVGLRRMPLTLLLTSWANICNSLLNKPCSTQWYLDHRIHKGSLFVFWLLVALPAWKCTWVLHHLVTNETII